MTIFCCERAIPESSSLEPSTLPPRAGAANGPSHQTFVFSGVSGHRIRPDCRLVNGRRHFHPVN